MFDRIFSNKNLFYFISILAFLALTFALYFLDQLTANYSYLVYTSSGEVVRTISLPPLFQNAMINFVIFSGAFIFFCLIAYYVSILRESEQEAVAPIQKEVDPTELTSENEVFYGKDAISEQAARTFIEAHPESAIKFIYQKNVDGSELDPLIKKLHRDWIIRGMDQQMVTNIVLEALEVDELTSMNLYELTLELKNKLSLTKMKESPIENTDQAGASPPETDAITTEKPKAPITEEAAISPL